MPMTTVMRKVREGAPAEGPEAQALIAPEVDAAEPATSQSPPDVEAIVDPPQIPVDGAPASAPPVPYEVPAAAAAEEQSAFVPESASNDCTPTQAPRDDDARAEEAQCPPSDGQMEIPTAPAELRNLNPQVWDSRRVNPVVVAYHDRASPVCEQFRGVRSRLLAMNAGRRPQVIAITSAIPEEGKSAAAINLSLIMAEGGGQRVLLVDADFRRPSIARLLGVPGEPGLADVLRGEAQLTDVLQPTPLPSLQVLAAGKTAGPDCATLPGGATIQAALTALRGLFDYTFIDTPPLAVFSDACALGSHCEGAIVIVQMRRTPEPVVQQAVRTLQANNVKVIGALLSRFSGGGTDYHERYNYR